MNQKYTFIQQDLGIPDGPFQSYQPSKTLVSTKQKSVNYGGNFYNNSINSSAQNPANVPGSMNV